jgi:hypothetical protein
MVHYFASADYTLNSIKVGFNKMPSKNNNLNDVDQKLQQWYQTDLGRKILSQQTNLAMSLCRRQHAHSVLHLGGVKSQFNDLAAKDAQVTHVALSELGSGQHPLIMPCADTNKLRPQSFDHIIITQCLEWYKAPVPLLNDCCQLLAESGRIVIYGFNPWSLWGLVHTLYQGTGLPLRGGMHSVSALQSWMRQLNLQIEGASSFCFRPPIKSSNRFESFAWLENVGKWCWPYCGAMYQVVAQKNVFATTSVWQGWRERRTTLQKSDDGCVSPKPSASLGENNKA